MRTAGLQMTSAVKGVRRLIETNEMPIGRISEHARRDQNIRKGHLHTLHVWWALGPWLPAGPC